MKPRSTSLRQRASLSVTLLLSPFLASTALADNPPIPAAILTFAERGAGVKGEGAKVSDILFGELVTSEAIFLVDRADLDKVFQELELSQSGAVSQQDAVKAGQLVGAKLMIMGSIIEAGESLYLVAKIVSTETSRTIGTRVKGGVDDELGTLVEKLATEVATKISESAKDLLPPPRDAKDIAAQLINALGDQPRPTVSISVPEVHIGTPVPDPAAQTEISNILQQAGFTLLDSASKTKPDVRITGEAFSEFAMRRGNLVSVRARVEISAVDVKTDRILLADRATTTAVGLSEHTTGKDALQLAGSQLAERLGPALVGAAK